MPLVTANELAEDEMAYALTKKHLGGCVENWEKIDFGEKTKPFY